MNEIGFSIQSNKGKIFAGKINQLSNLDVNLSTDENYPVGSGSNGTVTLTSAETAYTVPETASTKKHRLVVYNGSDTDMYYGFSTLTSGGIPLSAGEIVTLNLGASQNIYVYCTSAGKVINYSYKEID